MVKVDDLLKERNNMKNNNKKLYKKIYKLVETNIVNNNKKNLTNCFFQVSLFYHGMPLYSIYDCIEYITSKLKKNGFKIQIINVNGLFIEW